MKIYGMTVIKNEVDVIEHSLRDAEQWADKVIVYDNGSTDGTWEKVQELANDVIIPFKQDHKPYSDGLRADIFNAFKHELDDGDWWVIQDSDEIYDQNPRHFIESQPGYFHHINGRKIDFCFDLSAIDTIEFDPDFPKNLEVFDWYNPLAWSEPRAIKHRKRLTWEVEGVWPSAMGLICPELIPIRHYPFRSPEQIKRRWETRKGVKETGWAVDHWDKSEWRETYAAKLRDQQHMKVGEDVFSQVPLANNYKQALWKVMVKHILHRTKILP